MSSTLKMTKMTKLTKLRMKTLTPTPKLVGADKVQVGGEPSQGKRSQRMKTDLCLLHTGQHLHA